ncbi:hypothetical protein [Selenomonas sp. CM52]|uniref:hypothetical protein n=1 Tax=Selenomonas sp. CM52 TaxID=936381 RepID=UPI000688A5B0|nr:hypothetical protein [Selenomonas sp. CM52]
MLNLMFRQLKTGIWEICRGMQELRNRGIRVYLTLRYKHKNLYIEPTVQFIGRPCISMADGSKICIGENSTLVSDQYFNAMGLSHRVILRTLQPNAQIKIGKNVGMSGGTICAFELVKIGDNVGIGANCTILDSSMHVMDTRIPLSERDNTALIKTRPVIIEDDVMINMNEVGE